MAGPAQLIRALGRAIRRPAASVRALLATIAMLALSTAGSAASPLAGEMSDYRVALDRLLPMPRLAYVDEELDQDHTIRRVDLRWFGGLFAERSITVLENREHTLTIQWRRPAQGSIRASVRARRNGHGGDGADPVMASGVVSGASCPGVRKLWDALDRLSTPMVPRWSRAQDTEWVELRYQGSLVDHWISVPPEPNEPFVVWSRKLKALVWECDPKFMPPR